MLVDPGFHIITCGVLNSVVDLEFRIITTKQSQTHLKKKPKNSKKP